MRTAATSLLASLLCLGALAGCAQGDQGISLGEWGELSAVRVDDVDLDPADFSVVCERPDEKLVIVPRPAETDDAAGRAQAAHDFDLVVYFDERGVITTFSAGVERSAPRLDWNAGDDGPAPMLAADGEGGFAVAGWLERPSGEPLRIAVMGRCPEPVAAGPSASG